MSGIDDTPAGRWSEANGGLDPVGVAVVGRRLLGAEPRAKSARSARSRGGLGLRLAGGGADGAGPSLPSRSADDGVCRRARGSVGRGGRPRHTCLHPLRARPRGPRGRQARPGREAPGSVLEAGCETDPGGSRTRPGSHAGPHLPLQPTGDDDPRPHHLRRAGRDLLHLDEPCESRHSPTRRQRRLGSRAARFRDPALLAERATGEGGGDDEGMRHARHTGRRVYRSRSSGRARSHTSSSPGSPPASFGGRRSSAQRR